MAFLENLRIARPDEVIGFRIDQSPRSLLTQISDLVALNKGYEETGGNIRQWAFELYQVFFIKRPDVRVAFLLQISAEKPEIVAEYLGIFAKHCRNEFFSVENPVETVSEMMDMIYHGYEDFGQNGAGDAFITAFVDRIEHDASLPQDIAIPFQEKLREMRQPVSAENQMVSVFTQNSMDFDI